MKLTIILSMLILVARPAFSSELKFNLEHGFVSPNCEIDLLTCFSSRIESSNTDEKLKAIVIYLSNYDVLHTSYEYEKLLIDLKNISSVDNVNALYIQSLIYYSGYYVDEDAIRAVELLKPIEEKNSYPYVYELLGKSYYKMLLLEEDENERNELYKLSKLNFYSAHKLGSKSSTRNLAFIMLNYGGYLDQVEAGKLLEYLSSLGGRMDVEIYERYNRLMNK
ncbi:hypothetical protein AB4259_17875 [Vibrio amylolyticus]|uniref:hypothetical protein n=1 Tax=Vibrio amylolyticus TaxID=2847292 RepID=UPI00354BB2A0